MTMSNEERIARLEAGYEHLATKADLAEVRTDLKSDVAEVRTDLKSDVAGVRTDLADNRADFKSDIATAQGETTRRIDRLFWAVIGIGGGLLAVAAAALVRDALA